MGCRIATISVQFFLLGGGGGSQLMSAGPNGGAGRLPREYDVAKPAIPLDYIGQYLFAPDQSISADQLRQRHTKRIRNSSHYQQTWISSAAFYSAHVRQIDLCLKRQLLLRQLSLLTVLANILAISKLNLETGAPICRRVQFTL